ncbi:unnamed protein product [Angiostrongylus costaricensis]|uniref:Molybdopterin domain-containing protein n=1 Tax=Angiostrongylus costaricensis TaxID=334426 RepID=A0A0R3PZX0_ANGCS|nr:unnamed protein product [Angiostrongylus costaricensis]
MNIYTPADGLFQTHVTWEDIEADMQREFHSTASFGPNKSAKNISDCNVNICKTPDRRCLLWGTNALLSCPGSNAFTTTPCWSFVSSISQLILSISAISNHP